MNNKFDLADIQAFAAVAELQSFRATAEAIHLSQPAFSRRIDKLEEALGVRLLDRTTRRVTLTAVGRDFARKTRVWLDDLDAKDQVAQIEQVGIGLQCRLGHADVVGSGQKVFGRVAGTRGDHPVVITATARCQQYRSCEQRQNKAHFNFLMLQKIAF